MSPLTDARTSKAHEQPVALAASIGGEVAARQAHNLEA